MDTVGTLYAPTATARWSGVFGLSVIFRSPISVPQIQDALDSTLKDFRCMDVVLKKGIFWHYLEQSIQNLKVEPESDYPCRPFDVLHDTHLMRVIYSTHRLSVEFFHGVTDGGGGWIFVKALVQNYLSLMGVKFCDKKTLVLDDNTFISNNKISVSDNNTLSYSKAMPLDMNAYNLVSDKHSGLQSFRTPRAYRVDLPIIKTSEYYLTHFELEYSQLKALSRLHDASIGELLTTMLMTTLAIYKLHHPQDRKIVLNMSYDLRKRFKLQSLRNFFGYAMLQFDELDDDFFNNLKTVQSILNKIDDDYLIKGVNTNVKTKNKFISKIVPLAIKRPLINFGYRLYGERLATISFSNYGKMQLPEKCKSHIDRLESCCGVAKSGRLIEVSAITYNNKTVLTLCIKSKSTEIEKILCKVLESLNLSVTVDSNRE